MVAETLAICLFIMHSTQYQIYWGVGACTILYMYVEARGQFIVSEDGIQVVKLHSMSLYM